MGAKEKIYFNGRSRRMRISPVLPWYVMQFGKVTVKSIAAFNPTLHLGRQDAVFGRALDDVEVLRLNLQLAKTARTGEIQHVYLMT
ncbi:hypothetical protein GYMLUDRAFT_44923 [Collybiopsis luxurians FD-317 M1]|uniref:Uncharacterized protein n=1 Tax=Collybiopsis luxurians FD-317 M1 TaxID=944289 RepID=A0A0D0CTR3_9AGAR|nr:hypothetical protein GYMLUDRAFT_44923 [Collybiopsis luxurians FD-317 M1]